MASKAELEARVAELEAQIKQPELDLAAKVTALEEENRVLKEELLLAEKGMGGMTDTIHLLRTDLGAVTDEVAGLKEGIKESNERAASAPASVPDNSVMYRGKVYPIIYETSVKEMGTDWKRGYVPEDRVAVVIDKIH